MSSFVFPEYEELDGRHSKRKKSIRSQIGLPWSSSDDGKFGIKVKIPSTSTSAFMQYTTEGLDQLDRPHG